LQWRRISISATTIDYDDANRKKLLIAERRWLPKQSRHGEIAEYGWKWGQKPSPRRAS